MKINSTIFSIITLSAILLCTTLTSCTGKSESSNLPSKVVIGTQTLAEPEAIAKAEGWLKEAFGVDVDLVVFDSGRDVSSAMASGSIDFGLLGSVPASLAIANDVQCKVVYIQSVLGEIEALVVKNDLGVTGAADLSGLKIATTFSSTAHYSLLKYLQANNINSADVDIIDMKASDIVAAYLRGDIDGAFTWDPNVTTLLNNNGVMITSAKEVAELGYATLDVSIVRSRFAEEYPDLVKAYISCMERAVTLYNSDAQAAGEAMSKNIGISVDECLAHMNNSTWLTVETQKSPQWFGSSALTDNLFNTAMFLYEQGDITVQPTQELFINAVTGKYLNINGVD